MQTPSAISTSPVLSLDQNIRLTVALEVMRTNTAADAAEILAIAEPIVDFILGDAERPQTTGRCEPEIVEVRPGEPVEFPPGTKIVGFGDPNLIAPDPREEE